MARWQPVRYWSSDNLLVGTHTITLTATNSVGLSASTSITVVVDDDLDLLDPTLTVGPTQLGWTFTTNAAASPNDHADRSAMRALVRSTGRPAATCPG